MAIHARKYDPPQEELLAGETSVNALITPKGKYIEIHHWTQSKEGTKTTINIQIPTEIIEREMNKF